ncbi:MAG: tRNA (guanosine(37)-N1)-methyltransferase TrmD [Myxococcota bacterium]
MKVQIVTLFPEFFSGPLQTGLIGRAVQRGDVEIRLLDPRTHTQDVHRTVDDQPFGGGGGMVLKPGPLAASIREARAAGSGPVVLLSPQGMAFQQTQAQALSEAEGLILVCGRYEGFDERIRDLADMELSLGDFVMTGGEAAAFAVLDAVVRLRPGTLGNLESPEHDSFATGLEGLLEYPHYTRPAVWEGRTVPDVLRSGDHDAVARWRRTESLRRTRARRPDLLLWRHLEPEDLRSLHAAPASTEVRMLWVAPGEKASGVRADAGARGGPIPDGGSQDRGWRPGELSRLLSLAGAFALSRVFVSPDARGMDWLQQAVEALPDHVSPAPYRTGPAKRAPAAPPHRVRARDVMEAAHPEQVRAVVEAAGARWARAHRWASGHAPAAEARADVAAMKWGPWLVAVGSGVPDDLPVLPPVRQVVPGACLDRATVAALILDRWLREG